MQANRPSSCRRWTLMLRKPVPTGVVMGALSAHLVRRTLCMTDSGSGVPTRNMTSTPASCSSQLIFTPVASTHSLAAAASSGPVPSPVIRVTSCAMASDRSQSLRRAGKSAVCARSPNYQMGRKASNGGAHFGQGVLRGAAGGASHQCEPESRRATLVAGATSGTRQWHDIVPTTSGRFARGRILPGRCRAVRFWCACRWPRR